MFTLSIQSYDSKIIFWNLEYINATNLCSCEEINILNFGSVFAVFLLETQ